MTVPKSQRKKLPSWQTMTENMRIYEDAKRKNVPKTLVFQSQLSWKELAYWSFPRL